MKTREKTRSVDPLTSGGSPKIIGPSQRYPLLSSFVASSIFMSLALLEAEAQSSQDYTPMDPIPEVVDLPDPCDNPTTQMWGPDDRLGNLNYLTPERVSENLSLIRLGRVYELAHTLVPGQMGFNAYFDFKTTPGPWPRGRCAPGPGGS